MLYQSCVSKLSQKLLTLILLCTLLTSQSFGQEIVGPKTAKTSELVKLKVLKFEGEDPKYTCNPENNDWTLYRTLDGQLEIVFLTKVAKTYTFTLANNKDKKTILLTHSVEITKAGPSPDVDPTPVIIPNKLRDDLKAAYLVSPDAEKRTVLLKVYQDVLAQADDIENYGQAGTLLANLCSKRQGSTNDLRAVKDVVEKYFLTELSNDKNSWSKEKFKTAFTNVITVLADLRP